MQQIHVPLNPRGPASLFLALLFVAGCTKHSSQPESTSPAPPQTGNDSSAETSAHDEFVGSTTCAECHAEQHESYLRTAHSRSLSLVDPESEPRDDQFRHELSGRNYEIYRRDGRIRHREALRVEGGETIAESDYPVKYLIGSGRHSRTYLAEIDGFLVESPITWYESRREWDVSPGYNVPVPPGFERAADIGCLTCHVGDAESIDGSLHRIRFHELAIGCERCHGPGRDHVDAAVSNRPPDELAASITNPATLSRALIEDVCAQCHLRGDATVFLPGAGPMDFRPGRPLTSVRVDYFVESNHDQMKVVGHMEQMRLSRCYTQSSELTCTTCHDIHPAESDRATAEFYRSRCFNCHEVEDCGLPRTDDRRTAAEDNCLSCHMPRSQSDIPHIAFTHHRIGIHSIRSDADANEERPTGLSPWQDVAPLEPGARQRLEGLAYLELSEQTSDAPLRRRHQQRSLELLQRVIQQGEADGDVWAAMARLYWDRDPAPAIFAAGAALSRPGLSPGSEVNANFVLADLHFQREEWQQALPLLEKLITLRRLSEDWLLLGIVRHALGRDDGVPALEEALEINPFRDDVTETLAEVLQREGRHQEAAELRQRAAAIRKLQPQQVE